MANRLGKTIATALDTTAHAAHHAGSRIAGDRGRDAADTVVSTVLGRVRALINEPCTHHDHDK